MLGVEKPVGIGWLAQDLNPAGVCGNAARADARRGARLLEHLALGLEQIVAELAATPLTTVGG
jgi:creatinine amidohydrolase